MFKVRAGNSDAARGKSGGYRLIYLARSPAEVVLVTVYSKTEQDDVSPEEIRRTILEVEEEAGPESQGDGNGTSGQTADAADNE